MDRISLATEILDAICRVQVQTGEEMPEGLGLESRPFALLPNFDSLKCLLVFIELTDTVHGTLGITERKLPTVIPYSRQENLTIQDIADAILDLQHG